MSKVTTYERFEDALDARAALLNDANDYKAGFMLSWIKGLAATYPEVEGQMVVMTQMLEKWSAGHEANIRERLTKDA